MLGEGGGLEWRGKRARGTIAKLTALADEIVAAERARQASATNSHGLSHRVRPDGLGAPSISSPPSPSDGMSADARIAP